MAITLRPDTEQDALLSAIKEAVGEKTASKTIWRVLADYLPMRERIAELEARPETGDELASMRLELTRLAAAVSHGGVQQSPASIPAMDAPAFADVAERYLATRDDLTDNVLRNWRTTLAYVGFGKVAVNLVTVQDVAATLKPLMESKPSVATKLKTRVHNVFGYAIAAGLRQDNPADNVASLLPKAKAQRRNHASIDHRELGGVLKSIRAGNAHWMTKAAATFLALTACRSAEVRGATWDEIDLEGKTWTIPAKRMKAKREHVVPLSDQAVALLRKIGPRQGLVFPGNVNKTMRSMALSEAFRAHDGTAHGCRASFRTWAIEAGYKREPTELCLAHQIGLNSAEEAYLRSDLLDQRRTIMDAWGSYLG